MFAVFCPACVGQLDPVRSGPASGRAGCRRRIPLVFHLQAGPAVIKKQRALADRSWLSAVANMECVRNTFLLTASYSLNIDEKVVHCCRQRRLTSRLSDLLPFDPAALA